MEAPPSTVVHVDAERGFSGGEVQVVHLMEGLQAQGWRQILVAPPGAAVFERAPEGVKCVALAMRNNADLPAVLRLRGLLRGERSHGQVLLHLHTGRATWLGAWAARSLNVPVVSTRRMDRAVKRGFGTRMLYRKLVDRVVAISGPVAEGLRLGGVPEERISVIHSSVDPSAFKPADRDQARAELGLAPEDFSLLVLARLDRRKGLDVLLNAMNLVRKEAGLDSLRGRNERARRDARVGKMADPNATPIPSSRVPRLLIAGDGPELAALQEQVTELQLGDVVSFLGRRTDKEQLLAASDALVLASRFEGLGVAALEAMALGRAVIGTRVGGLAEAVLHGETGLLVEAEDARGLAGAIMRLDRDRDLCVRLGAAGPGRIEAAYHVKGMVAAYGELYGELLGNPPVSV